MSNTLLLNSILSSQLLISKLEFIERTVKTVFLGLTSPDRKAWVSIPQGLSVELFVPKAQSLPKGLQLSLYWASDSKSRHRYQNQSKRQLSRQLKNRLLVLKSKTEGSNPHGFSPTPSLLEHTGEKSLHEEFSIWRQQNYRQSSVSFVIPELPTIPSTNIPRPHVFLNPLLLIPMVLVNEADQAMTTSTSTSTCSPQLYSDGINFHTGISLLSAINNIFSVYELSEMKRLRKSKSSMDAIPALPWHDPWDPSPPAEKSIESELEFLILRESVWLAPPLQSDSRLCVARDFQSLDVTSSNQLVHCIQDEDLLLHLAKLAIWDPSKPETSVVDMVRIIVLISGSYGYGGSKRNVDNPTFAEPYEYSLGVVHSMATELQLNLCVFRLAHLLLLFGVCNLVVLCPLLPETTRQMYEELEHAVFVESQNTVYSDFINKNRTHYHNHNLNGIEKGNVSKTKTTPTDSMTGFPNTYPSETWIDTSYSEPANSQTSELHKILRDLDIYKTEITNILDKNDQEIQKASDACDIVDGSVVANIEDIRPANVVVLTASSVPSTSTSLRPLDQPHYTKKPKSYNHYDALRQNLNIMLRSSDKISPTKALNDTFCRLSVFPRPLPCIRSDKFNPVAHETDLSEDLWSYTLIKDLIKVSKSRSNTDHLVKFIHEDFPNVWLPDLAMYCDGDHPIQEIAFSLGVPHELIYPFLDVVFGMDLNFIELHT